MELISEIVPTLQRGLEKVSRTNDQRTTHPKHSELPNRACEDDFCNNNSD